ncbi:MAG TPA: capsule assembly Wzi family protein [Ignavibacteriaceae bacterium]|nr:capsule assembly Wzi family protein [Ignavibacteriaceae bacterium]
MRKLTAFLLLCSSVYAQAVFEPDISTIYDFLHRLSVKGVIEFNDEVLPLPRIFLARKLEELNLHLDELTELEKEELSFYQKEFYPEIDLMREDSSQISNDKLQLFNFSPHAGFRAFLYHDKDFTLNIDPVIGFSFTREFGATQRHRWNGAEAYGYYKKTLGFSLYIKDNQEEGPFLDRTKMFTPETGINLSKETENTIEYAEVHGTVSFAWDWGALSFGKDFFRIGSGRAGQIVLSSKAPSFPFIRLDFHPVPWFSFFYIHGWLYSNLLDSSSIRYTPVPGRFNLSQIEKYIAAHMISFYPSENLSLSLGESMIYSDKIEYMYLIPVMFFRLVDHYLAKKDINSGDNAQIFMNAAYKNYDFKTKLYGTLFIDELSVTDILKGGNLSAIGFTAGINIVDPGIGNSELVFEYTRLNPFVYMNSNTAQLFTSHGYPLGHWIGSNADQFYLSFSKKILRGLSLKVTGEFIRKGQTEQPVQQYQLPYPAFLFGTRRNQKSGSAELSYEIFHQLFAKISYSYSYITDQEPFRTPDYLIGSNRSFGISLAYGL